MPRVHGPQPKSVWLLLATLEQARNCAQLYVRLGYKYIVGWKDTAGYGLHAVRNVEWKKATDAPYVNL